MAARTAPQPEGRAAQQVARDHRRRSGG
jgi:hypothetical protein